MLAWHRLAAERGISVKQCQEQTSSSAFTDWMRYRLIEPSGPPVTAWQIALCATAIVRSLGGDIEPEDLMIRPFDHAYDTANEEGDLDELGAYDAVDLDGISRHSKRTENKPEVDLDD